METQIIEVEALQCDECGDYADVVLKETVNGMKAYRFLCDECFQKELRKERE